jgi:RNA polymerase sigma-70 factor (ECF subfamily)
MGPDGRGEPRPPADRPYGDVSTGGLALTELEIRDFLARDYPRIVNAMALLSGSLPAAEDAVQEALARAWERSGRGQWIDSLPAFVTTVARNLLRDRFRRLVVERRARRDLAERALDRSPFSRADDRTDLARALARLPTRQREVAVCHYVLDLDVGEIARVLDIPDGTVKSALFRARRSLAAALRADDGSETEVGDVTR